MATYTSRLNLKKPAASDQVDISDINGNSDKIDAGVVLKSGDTMTGSLTINSGNLAAAFDFVPSAVCNIGTDLNNAIEPGLYNFTSDYSNKPSSTGGSLVVVRYSSGYITQMAFTNSPSQSPVGYMRHYSYSTWGSWSQFASQYGYPYRRATVLSSTASVATANEWADTGLSASLEAGHLYAISVSVGSGGGVLGVRLRSGGTTNFEHTVEIGQSMANLCPVFYCNSANDYSLWVKRGGTGSAAYVITDIGMTLA